MSTPLSSRERRDLKALARAHTLDRGEPGHVTHLPPALLWRLIAARGVVTVMFGALALLAPSATLGALVLVYAGYMLIDGGLAVVTSLRAARRQDRWGLLALEGLVDLIACGTALMAPHVTLPGFAVLIATWAFLSGSILAAAGLEMPRAHGRWLLVLSGAVSLVWGLLVLVLPPAGMLELVWWLAAYALAFGAVLLALAAHLRSRGIV